MRPTGEEKANFPWYKIWILTIIAGCYVGRCLGAGGAAAMATLPDSIGGRSVPYVFLLDVILLPLRMPPNILINACSLPRTPLMPPPGTATSVPTNPRAGHAGHAMPYTGFGYTTCLLVGGMLQQAPEVGSPDQYNYGLFKLVFGAVGFP